MTFMGDGKALAVWINSLLPDGHTLLMIKINFALLAQRGISEFDKFETIVQTRLNEAEGLTYEMDFIYGGSFL